MTRINPAAAGIYDASGGRTYLNQDEARRFMAALHRDDCRPRQALGWLLFATVGPRLRGVAANRRGPADQRRKPCQQGRPLTAGAFPTALPSGRAGSRRPSRSPIRCRSPLGPPACDIGAAGARVDFIEARQSCAAHGVRPSHRGVA